MTILRSSETATSVGATEGDVKTFLTNLRMFMAEQLGSDSSNKALTAAALGAILNASIAKTAAYTVGAADRGKVLDCSGTWTLSIAGAASLGDGFCFALWNRGTGTITIDPNLSETIDGEITKSIGAGKFAIVFCNGSAFGTIGIGFALADLLAVDGSGSGLDADLLDGKHASDFSLSGHIHAYAPMSAITNISNFQVADYSSGPRFTVTRADGSSYVFVIGIPIQG